MQPADIFACQRHDVIHVVRDASLFRQSRGFSIDRPHDLVIGPFGESLFLASPPNRSGKSVLLRLFDQAPLPQRLHFVWIILAISALTRRYRFGIFLAICFPILTARLDISGSPVTSHFKKAIFVPSAPRHCGGLMSIRIVLAIFG